MRVGAVPEFAGLKAVRFLHARNLYATALAAGQLFGGLNADPEFQLRARQWDVRPGAVSVAAEHAALSDLHPGDLYAGSVAARVLQSGIDANPDDQLHAGVRNLLASAVPAEAAELADLPDDRVPDTGRLRSLCRHLLDRDGGQRDYLGRRPWLQQCVVVLHVLGPELLGAELFRNTDLFDEHEHVERLPRGGYGDNDHLLSWFL